VNSVGHHDFPVPTVEKIAGEAISLLNEAREPIASAAAAADALLLAAESELKAKKDIWLLLLVTGHGLGKVIVEVIVR
jgi:hypothetical protein